MAPDDDRQEWPEFQKAYWALLVDHARRWLGMCPLQSIDPEDVAQETMIRAWKARGKVARLDHPKAWLLKIQQNVLLSFCEKTKLKPLSSLDEMGFDPVWRDDDRTDEMELVTDRIDPLHWVAPHVDKLPSAAGNLLRIGLKLGCWDPERIRDEYFRETGIKRTVGGVRSGLNKVRLALLESFGWGNWIRALEDYRLPMDNLECSMLEMLRRSPTIYWIEAAERAKRDLRALIEDNPFAPHQEFGPKMILTQAEFEGRCRQDMILIAQMNAGGVHRWNQHHSSEFGPSYCLIQSASLDFKLYRRLRSYFQSYSIPDTYASTIRERLAFAIGEESRCLQVLVDLIRRYGRTSQLDGLLEGIPIDSHI